MTFLDAPWDVIGQCNEEGKAQYSRDKSFQTNSAYLQSS